MIGTQSSDLFGNDEEDEEFLEALMDMPVDSPSRALPPKRKRSSSPIRETLPSGADYDEAVYGSTKFGEWGDYMRKKRAKLQIQNSVATTGIFKGLAIHVNGYTNPSVQVLRDMITSNGGLFHAYLDTKGLVTHVVASNLTGVKVHQLKHMKIVRPEWIVNSVQQGVRLPWQDYRLETTSRVDAAQGSRTGQQSLFQATQGLHHGQTQARARECQTEEENLDSQYTGSSTSTPYLGGGTLGASSPSRLVEDDGDPSEAIYMTDPVTMEEAKRVPGYALRASNQAAQRLMQNPEWRDAHTAVAGKKFIEGYYQNSRLHHLSNWKAELRLLVGRAQENVESGEFVFASKDETLATVAGDKLSMRGAEITKEWSKSPGKDKGKGKATFTQKTIMHCDFDCFFVSAGLVDRPELRGKPAVVCHSQGVGEGAASTSEIASCSYEARAKGIKNGMSLGQARQLCPEVITIPYEFEKYKEISLKFYTILMAVADDLQAVSVDEALLDVTNAVSNLKAQAQPMNPADALTHDYAKDLAEMLRSQIIQATQCQISIGIGSNILLARFATKRAKPASSFHLHDGDAEEFLAPLPIDLVWGVGWSLRKKAEEKLGIRTIGELATKSKAALTAVFGPKMGEMLWGAARGLSDQKIESSKKRKSVSAEINFGIRFRNDGEAENFVRQLGEEVAKRLTAVNMRGRSLTLKVMKRHPDAPKEAAKFLGHGVCETFNRTVTLVDPKSAATNNSDVIGEQAWRALKNFHFDPTELRGLGVQITKLEDEEGGPESQSGQTTLQFGPKVVQTRNPMAAGTSKEAEEGGDEENAEYVPPMADEIDLDVLGELPEEIRRELEEDIMKQRRAQSLGVTPAPAGPGEPEEEDEIVILEDHPTTNTKSPPVTPKKSMTTTPNVSHITRQLRPKTRTIISPAKTRLFAKREHKAPQVSAEELKELGIDAAVFGALPADVQREQLNMSRADAVPKSGFQTRLETGYAGVAGGLGVGLGLGRAQSTESGSRFTRSPSIDGHTRPPLLVAKYAVAPAIVHTKSKTKTKTSMSMSTPGNGPSATANAKDGVLVRMTEATEVQAHIKRWVVECYKAGAAPLDADVRGLEAWTLGCINMHGTVVGVEKVVQVMRWWRALLRKYWDGEEHLKEMPDGGRTVGILWWNAFWDVKGAVDAALKEKKFGGRLSLR